MQLTEHQQSRIDTFSYFVTQGVESWVEAGGVLAALVDDLGESVYDAITEKIPGLGRTTLELFTAIGRREIYPMLAADQSDGAALLAGLPYESQEKFYHSGVPVVDRIRGGDFSVEMIPVSQLSRVECEQVFDSHRLRSATEQQEWILKKEQARAARVQKPAKARYQNISHGDRSGFDADTTLVVPAAVSLDALNAATPEQLLRLALDTGHAAMMDARRHLGKVKPGSPKDDLISHALNAIGKLRFAAANGEL